MGIWFVGWVFFLLGRDMLDDLGCIVYEVYGESVGWIIFMGSLMFFWEEQNDCFKQVWKLVV